MNAKKIVVITGSATGIGKSTAELFTSLGYTVIGLSRRLKDTETSFSCDLSREIDVKEAFAKIFKIHGKVDVLVNNAAIVRRSDPLQATVKEWEETMNVNVIGTFLCIQQVLPHMISRSFGRIINISSIAGRSYSKTSAVSYTASKYAVIGMTRQLAVQYGKTGVTINCVCPSQTLTEQLISTVSEETRNQIAGQIPLGRFADPKEVAHSIAFLANESSSYINGAILDVNGGQL